MALVGQKDRWWFITMPQDMSDHAQHFTKHAARFKSLKVNARIGSSEWQTSMLPSKERGQSYLLPIKKAIRDAEGLEAWQSQESKGDGLGFNPQLLQTVFHRVESEQC